MRRKTKTRISVLQWNFIELGPLQKSRLSFVLNKAELFQASFLIGTSFCRIQDRCKTRWCGCKPAWRAVLLQYWNRLKWFLVWSLPSVAYCTGKGCIIKADVSAKHGLKTSVFFWFAFYEETKRGLLQVDSYITWSTFTLCRSCFKPCALFEYLTEELNYPKGLAHILVVHCEYQRSKIKQMNFYEQATQFVLQRVMGSIMILMADAQKNVPYLLS